MLSNIRQQISFQQLSVTYYNAFTDLSPLSSDERKTYADNYPLQCKTFEAEYGTIRKEYFAKNIISAAVLTDSGYLDVVHNLKDGSEPERILFESHSKANEVNLILNDEARYRCNSEYYDVISYIIGFLDQEANENSEPSNKATRERVLNIIRSHYNQANISFERSAQRMAKNEYFKGMMSGALIWLILIAMIFITLSKMKVELFDLWLLPISLLAGGTGAIVSVLSRITFNKIYFDIQSGRKLLRRFGSFRIIIGAILGVMMCVLVYSGILHIAVPNSEKTLYFFAGIAFLSGFGERWAQDMLVAASSRVSAQYKTNGKTANDDG